MKVPVAYLLASLLSLVLLLPIASPFLVRYDENRLIRQTEEALLVEASVVAEAYRALLDPRWEDAPLPPAEDRFRPLLARLDRRSASVLPVADRGPVMSSSTATVAALDGILERAQVRTLSGLRVLDRRGVVIASPTRERGYSLAHLEEVQAALEGRYRPVLRQRPTEKPAPPLSSAERAAELRVSLAWPVFEDPRATSGPVIGVVYASRTPLDLGRSWWRARDELILPALIAIAGVLAVLAFLVRVIASPLSRLTRAALEVAAGREAKLLPAGPAPAEIHQLADALSRMREELERRADYVRVFAAQAVHELKTPLTSLRGASELLLEGDVPAEQARRFHTIIHEDALRMDKLVGRILELARIEASKPRRADLAMKALLTAIVERYARRGRDVRLEWSASEAPVPADAEQIDSMISNLIDNALRHGGEAPVKVSARELGAGVELVVEDAGPLLPEGHFDRAFERFYSTERGAGGTGLGLAIVRAVVDGHGGAVRAERRAEGGARFSVVLPRA